MGIYTYLNRNTISAGNMINRVLLMTDYQKKKTKARGFPNLLYIEPTNFCNLDCLMCVRRKMKRAVGYMEMSLFSKIIDEVKRYPVELIYLMMFGESLFHKNLIDMVKYCKKAGLKVGISTNATVLNAEISRKIVESGLDFFIISFDSVDPSTYNKIRKGARYEKTRENIETFLRIKGKRKPTTIIQSLIMKGNRLEKKKVQGIFSRYDVTIKFRPVHNWSGEDEDINELQVNQRNLNQNELCDKIWRHLTIQWDGTVVPCCNIYDKQISFGNVKEKTLKEIWNGERMKGFRKAHILGRGKIKFCKDCSYCGLSTKEKIALTVFDSLSQEKILYNSKKWRD